ncbi:MAG TPA: sulfite exporter TauE/SafE family protein [Rhizomicrobium sp.]|jgi:hypothetical protein|nr:sulfite exporter TauE/SafE family protein [Rhizomicrobium sp.]
MEFLQGIEPIYVISGLVVGGLVGFTGVGGGSLMTPILILLFHIHPASAVGTDLLYASITKTAGSAVHGYNKNIDWSVVGRLALGSLPAAALTIYLLYVLGVDSKPTQLLITRVLGFALLLTAILLVFRPQIMAFYEKHIGEPNPQTVAYLTVAVGFLLGVLVTISSVGAGAIGVTALVMLYPKMPAHRIVGSDIVHAVPLTLIAGLGHSFLGTINLHVLFSLLLGSIPAIMIASYFSVKIPDRAIRMALAAVLLLVCMRFWFVS